MAGVKGRSGGARPGAGRPPKDKPETVVSEKRDPLEWLLDVMQGFIEPTAAQVRAATAAAQYVHAKKGEGGKKEDAAGRAKAAGAGKFGSVAPPKLAAANGKKL